MAYLSGCTLSSGTPDTDWSTVFEVDPARIRLLNLRTGRQVVIEDEDEGQVPPQYLRVGFGGQRVVIDLDDGADFSGDDQ